MKVVSLFSGCGGADLGISGGFNFLGKEYETSKAEIIHASDSDAKAVETYNLNFKNPAEVIDIRDLKMRGLDADVVVGGFPCQSFSTVNPSKNPEDERGQLFWEMLRIIEETTPKVVIGENVKGFYRLRKGKYFEEFSTGLQKLGYEVHHKLLSAADFGVPQLRERLFVVGIRSDLGASYEFPKSTNGPDSKNHDAHVNLSAVIESVSEVEEKYYFSERAVQGVKNAKPNMKRAVAQDLEKPCLTITSHLAKVSLNSRDPVLLVDPTRERYRRFTPREAASIQSFPENFQFAGSEGDAYRQIGNAIPPVLMWHIYQSIESCLNNVSRYERKE